MPGKSKPKTTTTSSLSVWGLANQGACCRARTKADRHRWFAQVIRHSTSMLASHHGHAQSLLHSYDANRRSRRSCHRQTCHQYQVDRHWRLAQVILHSTSMLASHHGHAQRLLHSYDANRRSRRSCHRQTCHQYQVDRHWRLAQVILHSTSMLASHHGRHRYRHTR